MTAISSPSSAATARENPPCSTLWQARSPWTAAPSCWTVRTSPASLRTFKWGISHAEREQYRALLAPLGLGLEDRLTTKVGLLSGGQRQALTLLMASLKKPKLLLLDEHTAALDPKTAAKVLELSDRIVAENGLTTMMVTHNMKDAIAHGNRLIMMDAGRVVLDIAGREKQRLTVPDLLALFSEAGGTDAADDKLLLA